MGPQQNAFENAVKKLAEEVRAGVAKTRPITEAQKNALEAAIKERQKQSVAEKQQARVQAEKMRAPRRRARRR